MDKKRIGGVVAIIVGLIIFIAVAQSPEMKMNLPAINIDQPELSVEEIASYKNLSKQIRSGGVPKDGIPPVDFPQYDSREDGDLWLKNNDIVFGVAEGNLIAAYPQRILVFHEVVNEELDGQKVAVSYCPLTGTAIGYFGALDSKTDSTLGVSGKLLNSNLVMYDRLTDTYWPQILGQGIEGQLKGVKLKEFPVKWTTWGEWKSKYPQTKVLSRSTGFLRDYSEKGDPYGSYLDENQGYYSSDRYLFKPEHIDETLEPKAVIVGVRSEDNQFAVAIEKSVLVKTGEVEAKLGDQTIVVTYDKSLNAHEARIKETGEWINSFDAMWFAWVAFYPETELIN